MIELSSKELKRAAKIKERIEKLQSKLEELLGGASSPAPAVDGRKKRRKMSASARAKIGAAQRARWAKAKAVKK